MDWLLKIMTENPEAIVKSVKDMIDKYKPSVYELLHELLNVYKDFANNKELPAASAQAKRNAFNAYVEAGFSEEQAMAILISDNLHLMKNMQDQSRRISNNTNK